MQAVSIYITTDQKKLDGGGNYRYDIVLEDTGQSLGEIVQTKGSRYGSTLETIVAALKRINKPVDLDIYMGEAMISTHFYTYLEKWKASGFEESSSAGEWREIAAATEKHRVKMIFAPQHSMTLWQRNEISKKEE